MPLRWDCAETALSPLRYCAARMTFQNVHDFTESESFSCPRCSQEVVERFWGPCQACRTQLVAAFTPAPVDVEVARFEPAMHVTPNHVATRD